MSSQSRWTRYSRLINNFILLFARPQLFENFDDRRFTTLTLWRNDSNDVIPIYFKSTVQNSLQKKQVNHSKLIFFNCFSPVYAQEWSAPLPLYSIATVSDWLMTIEQWERFALFHEQIALPLTKNEQMAWKTAERIPNPELSCWETGRPLMRRSKKFQN